MAHTLLLVEDDENIMKINRNKLSKAGYRILTAERLSEAESHLANEQPDLIVLDIMLPDGDGVQWCKKIRKDSHDPPILFLSAKNTSLDILEGLKSGGDDYLPKPYDLEILLVKVELLLKKASRVPETITKGKLTLNVLSQAAYVNGKDLLLTKKEFSLLLLFIQNEGNDMGYEYLYEKIWNQPMNDDKKPVVNTVAGIREKLTGSECSIETVYGKGYRFGHW